MEIRPSPQMLEVLKRIVEIEPEFISKEDINLLKCDYQRGNLSVSTLKIVSAYLRTNREESFKEVIQGSTLSFPKFKVQSSEVILDGSLKF
jgi:hypothetical protein